jgi:hypothetical protein
MKLAAIPNPAATGLLGVFFLIANLGNALYAAHGLQPSGGFVLLFYVGFGFAAALWMHADSRRLAIREDIDQGWFVYLAWPVLLPYHLFKTRGKRGAVTLLGLVGLYVATYLASLLVFLLARQGVAPK